MKQVSALREQQETLMIKPLEVKEKAIRERIDELSAVKVLETEEQQKLTAEHSKALGLFENYCEQMK